MSTIKLLQLQINFASDLLMLKMDTDSITITVYNAVQDQFYN
jgi:hypothetical protein